MKNIILSLMFVVIGVVAAFANGRGPASKLATPIFEDNGNTGEPYRVTVGSSSAVDIFTVITTTPTDKIRQIEFKNPSETYDLMIGTFSGFTSANAWTVDSGSGTWATSNLAYRYLKYPPESGSATEPVRIAVEAQ